jgi:tripartite-type tricarboxylate transporter receptor subunit TctC
MQAKSSWLFIPIVTIAVTVGVAVAQDFPTRPVRFLVPFAAGGGVDLVGRSLAQPMSRSLGQSVVVENRSGANTVLAAELVMRAPADGHTVFLMAPSFTVNPLVRSDMPYDTLKDFSGVTRLASTPFVFAIHPSVPAKNLKEFVALARSRPGQMTFATSSILGSNRLVGELFNNMVGIELVNVAYNSGAPATTSVIGGHNAMLVASGPECITAISSGRLKGLAVTSSARFEGLPNLPTVAESGYPGFEALNWYGAVVRAATPRPVVDRLNAEIVRALQLPEIKSILTKQSLTPAAMSPQEFDAFLRAEMQRYEGIVKKLNVKID